MRFQGFLEISALAELGRATGGLEAVPSSAPRAATAARGPRIDCTCSGGMNPPRAKVLRPWRKTLARRRAPPKEPKKYGARKQPVRLDRLFCCKTDITSALAELGRAAGGLEAVLLSF